MRFLFSFDKSKSIWSLEYNLVQNIIAGFTVSITALVLGAAFGVLSGRGAFAGMISASLIAFFTSVFGGTRIQCSGPTGPMTAVTSIIVAAAHDKIIGQFPNIVPDHFVNIVLFLTAAILIFMGIFRLGKWIAYVPNIVISGFMDGIAIIIWISQMKKLFGFGGIAGYSGPLYLNLTVTIVSIILVFVLPKIFQKAAPGWMSILSGTFITVLFVSVISNMLALPIERVHLTSSIYHWKEFAGVLSSQWPSEWTLGIIFAAIPFAIQLGILAYLDTMLTSLVIDKLTKEKSRRNKELIAQGIGTAAVAIVGGIPGAQATIRSVLLVNEKATNRLAGTLAGVLVFIELLLFQDVINLIPQAVFSGIIIKIGYDVFDFLPIRFYVKNLIDRKFRKHYNFCPSYNNDFIHVSNIEILVITGTALLTVFWDLNFAIGIFTLFFYLWNKVIFKRNPMKDMNRTIDK